MTPTYSKINPQELADMKEKYGPWLDEQEALYLIKREREQGMREELFTSSGRGSISFGGLSTAATSHVSEVGSEGAGVTANQRLLGPDNSVEGSLTPAAQGAPTDPTNLRGAVSPTPANPASPGLLSEHAVTTSADKSVEYLPEGKLPRVTCEQIASFNHPYRLLALVVCMIALEAWMLARLLH